MGPKCAGSPISWSMCCRLNVILIVKFCSDELSEKRHLLFWGYSFIYVYMIDLDKEACEKIKVSSIVDSTVKTNFYWNGFGIGTKYFQSEITLSTCFEKINWVFSEAQWRWRIIRIWKSNLPNGAKTISDVWQLLTRGGAPTCCAGYLPSVPLWDSQYAITVCCVLCPV